MNARIKASKRLLAWFLLCPLAGSFVACERQDAARENDGSETSAPEVSFKPPQVDLSGLPMGLRDRIRELEEKTRQGSQVVEACGTLGAVYYVHGFPEAALKCFEHAASMKPDVMHWRYGTGLVYEQLGKLDKAAEEFQRALELDANYAPVYARLAATRLKTDPARAAMLCQRSLELSPQNPAALYTLGLCDEAAGDAALALSHYEEALKMAPSYADAHAAAGRLYAASGDQAKADEHAQAAAAGSMPPYDQLELLLRKHGFDLDVLLREALALATRGKFSEADQILLAAADVDGDGVKTRNVTGAVRDLEGRLEEAIAEYRAVLQVKPDVLEVRLKLADVLARNGAIEEAEREYRGILMENPDNAFALERFSRLLMTLDRRTEAADLIRAAVERNPEAAWLHFQLGLVLYYSDESDLAREQLTKCIELDSGFARAKYFLGLIESLAGADDKAVEYWRQTVADAPGFRDAYLAMQQTAMKQHDYSAAEKCLRDGLANIPDDAALNNSLAWLLAVSPVEEQRNGEEALRLAELACNFTQYKQHGFIDTLAAAYARVGKFEEAAAAARQAIDLARQGQAQPAAEAYEARLKLYEQDQPYSESK